VTDLAKKRIVVTGGAGFLGQAVLRVLRQRGVADEQIVVPRRREFDLTVESHVERLYETAQPDVVLHLAAEVGGIGANMEHPGRFFYANMAMGLHLVEHARRRGLISARAIRHGIGALNGELAAAGQPLVRLRLGLHSGWVLAGSVGSRERWEYGVVGDAVNCAARIDALAGPPLSDGCRILVSAVSRDLAGAGGSEGGEANGGGGQPWGAMPLGGRREPMEIWEL
jgi:class 3 adenylate cyclase